MRSRTFKRPTSIASYGSDEDVVTPTIPQGNASLGKKRIRKNRTIPLFRPLRVILQKKNAVLAITLLIVGTLMLLSIIFVKYQMLQGNPPKWTQRRNIAVLNNNKQQQHRQSTPHGFEISSLTKDFTIVLASAFTSKKDTDFPKLQPFGPHRIRDSRVREFGGLHVTFLEDENKRVKRREIYHDYNADRGYYDLSAAKQDDDDKHDYYYAFDDDRKRNPLVGWSDDRIQDQKTCRRNKWYRELPINCNTIHEFGLQNKFANGRAQYLGGGAYREVYLAELLYKFKVVFKTFDYEAKFSYEDFEFMRMDAIVAEKLSWSPRIVGIYGYCGLGMINEAMDKGDIEKVAVPGKGRIGRELNDTIALDVRNDLKPIQKLKYALDMAEGLLLLHGYTGGVIVHDDVQLSQYLLDAKGNLKLNDFNRAEIMFWNEHDHEYCKYRNNPGKGDWRAPQEYKDEPLDEKIDVWSIGNNMYSLLTGMFPYYEAKDTKAVQKIVKDGGTPKLDSRYHNRSVAEGKLLDIIKLCYEYDADKRIDIFQLTTLLRRAYQEVQSLEVKA